MKPFIQTAALIMLLLPVEVFATDEVEHHADLVNWAYSVFQGSGIYTIHDTTIGVLSLPFSSEIVFSGQIPGTLEISYPVTVGFYDYDIRLNGLDNLDDRLGTVSLIPGLHYHYPINKNWTFTPFVDAGMGKSIGESGFSWIYSAGLESRYKFSAFNQRFMFGNRLRWAGYTVGNSGYSDDYTNFESILEHFIDTDWMVFNRKVDFTTYGFNQINIDTHIINDILTEESELEMVWEIGAMAGFTTDNKDDFLHSLRVGLGYRFGSEHQGVSIIFGDKF